MGLRLEQKAVPLGQVPVGASVVMGCGQFLGPMQVVDRDQSLPRNLVPVKKFLSDGDPPVEILFRIEDLCQVVIEEKSTKP